MARQLRHLAMPADQRDKRNPLPSSADNLHEGLEHFADHCAMCHGNNGSGDTPIGRGLYPKPPVLREADTQSLTDGELFSIIQNGIRFTGMPAFAGDHGDEDTWRLVLFIRHLPKVTDRELAEMEKLNPHGPVEAPEPASAPAAGKPATPGAGKPAAPHTHTHPHKGSKG